MKAPVLGDMLATDLTDVLGSPYREFQAEPFGVIGLGRVDLGIHRLDLLAVAALLPGRGDFGRFLAAAMAVYEEIAIWYVVNEDLAAMLVRRGFVACVEVQEGDKVDGYRWVKSSTPNARALSTSISST